MTEATFRDAFAAAIARRQVSLAWLSQKLTESGRPVSVTALSYWRSGRSQPERATSLEALDEIEGLLDLRAGSLGSLIGPSKRPGPRPAERTTAELFADRPGILPALAALGFEGLYDELVEEMRQITVDVDASGCATGVQVRALVRARRDGARRSPVIVTVDDPGHVPTFVAVAGCSFGRSWLDPESGVFATELILDRELARGEAHLFELQVLFPEPSADTWYDHIAARRMSGLLIWVRFDRSRLPTHVEQYTETDHGHEVRPLDLGGGTSVHARARSFGPGIMGIRWTW